MSEVTAIRGMNDILPQESMYWQFLERMVSRTLESYGYGEMRLPLVEKTALFKRSIGEVTDIVEKEMYTFEDRNGESITLRPEGTAGCVRAAIQQRMLAVPQRLWYRGPMFRYERPQKGRQRQFHQIGAEAFGVASVDMDAELILLSARLWRGLGIANAVQLEINSIGSAAARHSYREALVAFLGERVDQLDEDSRRRLDSNPLRILDSKNPETQVLLSSAPALEDYLDVESRADFERLCALLEAAGVNYTVNRRLVRGLDYYNKTVFEWVTQELGAQGTVCAGGRYDSLVAQLGGKDTPAVGFAMGVERLVLLLMANKQNVEAASSASTELYVVAVGEAAYQTAMVATERLRESNPTWCILQHTGGGSFKSQMKKADKSGAQVALIWGEDEVATETVTIKPLRAAQGERSEQEQVLLPQLQDTLRRLLA